MKNIFKKAKKEEEVAEAVAENVCSNCENSGKQCSVCKFQG